LYPESAFNAVKLGVYGSVFVI